MLNSAQCRLPSEDASHSRRTFLTASAGCVAGLTASLGTVVQPLAAQSAVISNRARHVIFINLVGGPSQIDTWDPKPSASSEIRNADGVCATTIPGVLISENFPRLAQRMHQVNLIRTLHHDGPATHAAGQQLLMTGRVFHHNQSSPHFGSLLAWADPAISDLPANVILGGTFAPEFISERHGQDALDFADAPQPTFSTSQAASEALRRALDLKREAASTLLSYGSSPFSRQLLQARRLVERGVRAVTINQSRTVYDRPTWDMHANGGRLNVTPQDYRDTLCPELDQALCGLLDDLRVRGLLSETIVAVTGEMGRSPRWNQYGGRDHHTGVWSAMLFGGPLRSGQVIGESDSEAAEPISRPVTPAEFLATIFYASGIDLSRAKLPAMYGASTGVLNAQPVTELL